MRIISCIEQPKIIKKILKHLNLWDTRNNSPPVKGDNHVPEITYAPMMILIRRFLKLITGVNSLFLANV